MLPLAEVVIDSAGDVGMGAAAGKVSSEIPTDTGVTRDPRIGGVGRALVNDPAGAILGGTSQTIVDWRGSRVLAVIGRSEPAFEGEGDGLAGIVIGSPRNISGGAAAIAPMVTVGSIG